MVSDFLSTSPFCIGLYDRDQHEIDCLHRDMYYEKWGFMLIFWNLAGVPLSYCHCTIYLANHDPATYAWPRWVMALLFTSYLFVYWVWDTCNSQKNMFRSR